MTAQLAGRIAVITGAGSGLGAALGRAFASARMAVAALAHRAVYERRRDAMDAALDRMEAP